MANLICTNCGAVGRVKKDTPGSIWIELILWLLLIVPGIIYSVWRISSRRRVCSSCGSPALVPVESPVGRQLLAKAHAEIAP